MSRGVGDEGLEDEVPPMLFEIEVRSEVSPAEVEGGSDDVSSSEISTNKVCSRPRRPHLPILSHRLAPFMDTGRKFGNWLFEVLDGMRFLSVTALFHRYTVKRKLSRLKRLVAFGRCTLKNLHVLYFLEGLHLIAANPRHKDYITRVHRSQLQKFWRSHVMFDSIKH